MPSLASVPPPLDSESWKMVSIYVSALHALSKKHDAAQHELAKCREELAKTKLQLADEQKSRQAATMSSPPESVTPTDSAVAAAAVGALSSHSSDTTGGSLSGWRPQEKRMNGSALRSKVDTVDSGCQTESSDDDARARPPPPPTDSATAAVVTASAPRRSRSPRRRRGGGITSAQQLLVLATVGVLVGFSIMRWRRYLSQGPNNANSW